MGSVCIQTGCCKRRSIRSNSPTGPIIVDGIEVMGTYVKDVDMTYEEIGERLFPVAVARITAGIMFSS